MIICLTGYSCIGKTSAAKYLAYNNNISLISIREVSHELAKLNGYSRTREWLNNISVDQYLLECCKSVMLRIDKNQNYVIDDLFDKNLWIQINNIYPSVLIALELSKTIRIARMCKRGSYQSMNEAIEELDFLDNYKEQFGIKNVIQMSKKVIDVENKSIDEVANLIFLGSGLK